MEQSIVDHWNSFFKQLQQLFPTQNIQLPRTGSGIYSAWHNLYVGGKQIGPATSYEYNSIDWQAILSSARTSDHVDVSGRMAMRRSMGQLE